MRKGGMISIRGVVIRQFPIRAVHHFLSAVAYDDVALRVAVQPRVEVLLRGSQVFGQRRQFHVEGRENKLAVGLYSRDQPEAVFVIAEIAAVALRPWHRLQPSIIAKGPRMVRTLEPFGATGWLATNCGTAVGTAVQQDIDFPSAVA